MLQKSFLVRQGSRPMVVKVPTPRVSKRMRIPSSRMPIKGTASQAVILYLIRRKSPHRWGESIKVNRVVVGESMGHELSSANHEFAWLSRVRAPQISGGHHTISYGTLNCSVVT